MNITALSSAAPMTMPNRFKLVNNEEQTDFDWNVYDFNARGYDAVLGRFMQVDPLADQRDWLNPYNYVQNNPLLRVDPAGMLDNYYLFEDGTMHVVETNDNSNTYYYVDDVTGQHDLGTFAKNENGLVGIDEFSYTNGDKSAGFEVKDGNQDESYMSGDALGALLGALFQSGVSDLVITRVSDSEGKSPGDSESHKEGNVFDSRFLRNDGSNEGLDLRTDFNKVDMSRTSSFNKSLNTFGWKDLRATVNIVNQNDDISGVKMTVTNRVMGTQNLKFHNDHQHNQGFKPKVIRHKK